MLRRQSRESRLSARTGPGDSQAPPPGRRGRPSNKTSCHRRPLRRCRPSFGRARRDCGAAPRRRCWAVCRSDGAGPARGGRGDSGALTAPQRAGGRLRTLPGGAAGRTVADVTAAQLAPAAALCIAGPTEWGGDDLELSLPAERDSAARHQEQGRRWTEGTRLSAEGAPTAPLRLHL